MPSDIKILPHNLNASNFKLWHKERFEETLTAAGPEAAACLDPVGNGLWYTGIFEPMTQITQVIKQQLMSPQTSSTRQAILTRKASSDSVSNDESSFESANNESIADMYDLAMFCPMSEVTIVSNGLFAVHKASWLNYQSKVFNHVSQIKQKKAAVWSILEQSISIAIFNNVKAIPDYDEKVKIKDVVWFFKKIYEVVVLKQQGVTQIDFWNSVVNLVNTKQKQHEDDTTFYERFMAQMDTFKTQCTIVKQTTFTPDIFAAAYLGALSTHHKEFITTTTNWAKSGLKDFPENANSAHQRCLEFRPVNAKDHEIIQIQQPQQNVFVTNASVTSQSPKKLISQSADSSKFRDLVESRNEILVWKNNGKKVLCKYCSGNHLNADCNQKSNRGSNNVVDNSDAGSNDRTKLNKQLLSEVLAEKSTPGQLFVNFENVFATGVTSDTVLLDNECSRGILNNADHFIPGTIVKLDVPIPIQGIGRILVEYEGNTRRFGKMLYCPSIPCQILCFYDVQERYPITWNQDTNSFTVTFTDGFHINFTATNSSRMYTYTLPTTTPIVDSHVTTTCLVRSLSKCCREFIELFDTRVATSQSSS